MWYYDIEVFKYDWLIVFRKGKGRKNRRVVINDIEYLKEVLIEIGSNFLVGFNNYEYDDPVMASILLGKDPYETTQRLIEHGERELKWQYKLHAPVTIDVYQELGRIVSLKEIEANQGKMIFESSVPFDIQRKLTKSEIKDVVKYCDYDVRQVMNLMDHPERISYFSAKIGLIKEFDLPHGYIKFTRAKLMSHAMKCDKRIKIPNDRLNIEYVDTVDIKEINPNVIKFYDDAKHDFYGGGDYKLIEKREYVDFIDGVPHKYGFGGLHGALKNYKGKGLFVHADFASFYPALMIFYDLLTRKTKHPEILEQTYNKRLRLKAIKDPQQQPLKIGINAVFGVHKDEYNLAFDPKYSNDICINGQLIITLLAQRLVDFGQLIQTNTDGIIFRLDDPEFVEDFREVSEEFADEFRIGIENHYITQIYQRDVNNYIFEMIDGDKKVIEAIGMFKRWEEEKLKLNITSNSYSIIDIALKKFYIDNIPVEETILDLYDRNIMLPFQKVTKMGRSFYKMCQMIDGEMVDLTQSVNRVFASRSDEFGHLLKVKKTPKVISRRFIGMTTNNKGKEVKDYEYTYEYDENGDIVLLDSYNKVSSCPDHVVIHNDDISTFDKTQLDLQFYVDLVNNKKF